MTSIATEQTRVSSSSRRASAPPSKGVSGRMAFVREFIRSPRVLGTCFTSSERLARAMVEGLDLEGARAVVEYGPGTGAVTGAVLERIPGECRFVAIERSPGLARVFRGRFPGVRLYEDDAANVRRLCKVEGIAAVDCIVSGLPWLLFPEAVQRALLRETVGVLRPGGGFTTVTYRAERLVPGVGRFRRLMEEVFSEVALSRRVWGNIPPAFVYRCRK